MFATADRSAVDRAAGVVELAGQTAQDRSREIAFPT
jgi:hypothetical protein